MAAGGAEGRGAGGRCGAEPGEAPGGGGAAPGTAAGGGGGGEADRGADRLEEGAGLSGVSWFFYAFRVDSSGFEWISSQSWWEVELADTEEKLEKQSELLQRVPKEM